VHGGVKQYAYTPKPFATALSVGAGASIDLTELLSRKARVQVKEREKNPLFPVFYSWYDQNPFATVLVTNNEKNTITDVSVSFYMEQYMGSPKTCTVTGSLKPGESVEVPLRAFFEQSIFELTETIQAGGKVIVTYKSLGSDRRSESPLELTVHHRNAMSWEDDRRAAAFVSARDPASLWFSRYAYSVVQDRQRPGVNQNIQQAMALFESLNVYGINYVIDPSSSYADTSSSSASIDFLQYPYQTLMYRGGDCDDLSILYSSLLESMGIESAFITVPGHIYVAFDTGLSEEEAKASFYDPSMLIYSQGLPHRGEFPKLGSAFLKERQDKVPGFYVLRGDGC
jgi:hypothetical protein